MSACKFPLVIKVYNRLRYNVQTDLDFVQPVKLNVFKETCYFKTVIKTNYSQDGMIRMMGNHLIIPGGTRPIDACGKFLLPGGIDLNVHLQRPGYETQTIDDFYQGTKAALMGGTTMVVDMVVPDKDESLVEAFDKWRRWADDKVFINKLTTN